MRRLKESILIVLFCFSVAIGGCGESYEEPETKKKTKFAQLMENRERLLDNLSAQIAQKYNPVQFPPPGSDQNTFTYELQRYLSTYSERVFLFKGYLDDVVKTEQGIVVEFLCPLGPSAFLTKVAVRFRLIGAETSVQEILGGKRPDAILRDFRFVKSPDYLVVAKLDGLEKIRHYELDVSGYGDEAIVDITIPPSFISTGTLVKAIPIPEGDGSEKKELSHKELQDILNK